MVAHLPVVASPFFTRADSTSILDLLLDRQADLGFDFAVVTDPGG